MANADNLTAAGASRPAKTRSWILTAFNRLVLGRRYETVSVGEVSRRAGVGRSTFYEHFQDKDDLLRQAIGPVLAPLADAAVGSGDVARVQAVLDHIAEYRIRALAILGGAARTQVETALAELILARLGDPPPNAEMVMRRLDAARRAGAAVAVLLTWLAEGEETICSADVAAILARPSA